MKSVTAYFAVDRWRNEAPQFSQSADPFPSISLNTLKGELKVIKAVFQSQFWKLEGPLLKE
jgi:hypothetical protein